MWFLQWMQIFSCITSLPCAFSMFNNDILVQSNSYSCSLNSAWLFLKKLSLFLKWNIAVHTTKHGCFKNLIAVLKKFHGCFWYKLMVVLETNWWLFQKGWWLFHIWKKGVIAVSKSWWLFQKVHQESHHFLKQVWHFETGMTPFETAILCPTDVLGWFLGY